MPADSNPDRSIVVALAGDAMLGRRVADAISSAGAAIFSAEIEEAVRAADFFVLNLECCISDRGSPWPAPGKPFFFRAPPRAAELLARAGVDCVTLANNHALDFGTDALLDTIAHLDAAGIRHAGAGPDVEAARAPVVLEGAGFRLGVVAATDHPAGYAAREDRPGVAYADFQSRHVPEWVLATIAAARRRAHAVLFSPHWGPNLPSRPVPHVRAAAAAIAPQATLIAGHSAHVFHGVGGNVLYDLGDFVNDYSSAKPARSRLASVAGKLRREISGKLPQRRVQRLWSMFRARRLRADLGLLFFATIDHAGLRRLEALPLKLGYCRTGLAKGAEADFALRRFRRACLALGTAVTVRDGRAVIAWR